MKVKEKNPTRVEAGRRNVQNGKNAEAIVKTSCIKYKECGIAYIEKNAEPVQNLGPIGKQGGIYMMRYAQKAKPDFEGVLRGGRAILFDCKVTMQTMIRASVVTKGQAYCLDQYEQLGAVAAVLVCIGFEKYYFVPWQVWKKMKTLYGHMHMTEEELTPYRVPYDEECGIVYFLKGIIKEKS